MKPGDHVHVAAFGKGIVREVRNGGRCLVEVKGRAMLVNEKQLAPLDPPKSGAKSGEPPGPAVPEPLARPHAAASLDLHGMTMEEAVTALDTFVNDALLAGLADVRVIHGRSGGRLKAAVHARLKLLPPVRAWRVDSANPGVTIVTF